MNTILFRGKRVDAEEWVYGNYAHTDCYAKQNNYIYQNNPLEYAVIPETVSQFTGITDRNGKKVFEGDIIELPDRYVEVTWSELNAQYDLTFVKYKNVKPIDFNGVYMKDLHKYEVVANIHDSPDFRLRIAGEESDTEKTAEWISHNPGNPIKEFHCSNCIGLTETPHYTYNCYYKYCPNCGYRMKGCKN